MAGMMKRTVINTVLTGILVFSGLSHDVWSQSGTVTPYGDFCPKCGKYGTCNSVMTDYDAEKALKDYYNEKGLRVEVENSRGRFIRAKIRNEEEVVDVIIFDRHTGRVRSIY